MYDFFVKHFDKISLLLKEPIFYVLAISIFLLGMKFFHAMHQGELTELQLKAERLDALEKKYGKEIKFLNNEQLEFLKVVYEHQKTTPANKVVISSKDGVIFDDQARKLTTVNLVREVFEKEPTESNAMALSDLILSMPTEYMKLIPEMRFDSPFVVRVTQEGVEKLKEFKSK